MEKMASNKQAPKLKRDKTIVGHVSSQKLEGMACPMAVDIQPGGPEAEDDPPLEPQ